MRGMVASRAVAVFFALLGFCTRAQRCYRSCHALPSLLFHFSRVRHVNVPDYHADTPLSAPDSQRLKGDTEDKHETENRKQTTA